MAQSIPETLGLARSIKQYSFGAPANGWTEEKADSERRTQRGVRNDNVLWEVGVGGATSCLFSIVDLAHDSADCASVF